uniref:Uncharacterized protein n=1 Tax=Ascaris lumbricoides TaxID=6252 RepID=A0A0M3HU23_ASCLU
MIVTSTREVHSLKRIVVERASIGSAASCKPHQVCLRTCYGRSTTTTMNTEARLVAHVGCSTVAKTTVFHRLF